MRVLPILAALGLALATTACAYIERQQQPSRTVVRPAPSTPPAVMVPPR